MNMVASYLRNVKNLLRGTKLTIDYYQREYRWGASEVEDLINDLTREFRHYQKLSDSKKERHGHYFLGSIITSNNKNKDNQKFIIDGQQRLISIVLLLIYLRHQLKEKSKQYTQITNLIYSKRNGELSLNVPECGIHMKRLFDGDIRKRRIKSESATNVQARYSEMGKTLPKNLSAETQPYDIETLSSFANWFSEKVYFIEITAASDADAYTIFETTNDRGIHLTHIEILKGYLLSQIDNPDHRDSANREWQKCAAKLKYISKRHYKDEEGDTWAVQGLLRSQYAEDVDDFDQIESESYQSYVPKDKTLGFHRWVRRNHEKLMGLTEPQKFQNFIQKDFKFYAKWSGKIWESAKDIDLARKNGFETIYFNANSLDEFTYLQDPVLLAPLQLSDSDDQIRRKIRIVAKFLDIYIARQLWSKKGKEIKGDLFDVILKIRKNNSEELTNKLIEHLNAKEHSFFDNMLTYNDHKIRVLLTRITEYVDRCSGEISNLHEYFNGNYDVEHIWGSTHYENYKSDFQHEEDPESHFNSYRHQIGGLLLLDREINRSLRAAPYNEKRKEYLKEKNLLARSLHEGVNKHPEFQKFREEFRRQTGLDFKSHKKFGKKQLDARQKLYCQIAERIWDPETLREELKRK